MAAKAFRTIGRVDQIGYVVNDMQSAIRHWTEVVGVGPFILTEHIEYRTFAYHGEETGIDLSLAISYIGDVQVELIYQHNDVPSMYRTLQRTAKDGVCHIAQYVDDFEVASAGLIANGAKVIQYSQAVTGEETLYLETDHHNGGLIEFIRVTDEQKAGLALFKQTVAKWDGLRPIRYPGIESLESVLA